MYALPKKSLAVKQKKFLHHLFRAARQPKKVSLLLRRASPSQIKALGELSYNLLHRSLPHTNSRQVTQLKPHRSVFRKLGDRNLSVAQKKKFLLRRVNQSGGLPFLIPFLAPIIGTLVAAGIERVI